MALKSCLGLLSLADGCRQAGWYLIGLYVALASFDVYRLVQRASALQLVDDPLAGEALDPAIGRLLLELLFFALNVLAGGLLVAGAARRRPLPLAMFVTWFVPVTAMQALGLCVAVVQPAYAGLESCRRGACLAVLVLLGLLVAFHGYLCVVTVSFLLEVRGEQRRAVADSKLEAAGVQRKDEISFNFAG